MLESSAAAARYRSANRSAHIIFGALGALTNADSRSSARSHTPPPLTIGPPTLWICIVSLQHAAVGNPLHRGTGHRTDVCSYARCPKDGRGNSSDEVMSVQSCLIALVIPGI